MGKGARIKKARERPAEKICTGFSTDNYRILKWSAMLLLSAGISGTMLSDITRLGDIGRHVLESIGYISVPLYSFLEVKAFHHTKSKWRHLRKIFLTALASFVPFSLMKTGRPFDVSSQSACVTALIGFVCLWIADRNFQKPFEKYLHNKKILKMISFSARGMIAGLGAVLAHYLNAQDGLYALPMLMILDSAEKHSHKKFVQGISLAVWCLLMILSKNFYALTAPLALFLIYFLQDKKISFQIKNETLNEYLKIMETTFYPVILWGLALVKFIALIA